MEDKQLNLNQPLLSVRRSSAPTLALQKTDAKKTRDSHPFIPRLPPCRPQLKSGPITKPGVVPFLWEQTPGQPKQETTRQTQSIAIAPVGPKLPPGRYPKANKHKCDKIYPAGSENAKNVASSRETMEEKSSDSADSDGAYEDACDSRSWTESFFLDCSMNELDDFDMKPSGKVSTDPQTHQGFMMDRFLVAAKAMASETPHHAPKKQPVAEEEPQQVKPVINEHKPSLRYGPSFTKRYSSFHDNKAEETDSDDGYDDERGSLAVACGLLPQFCLKSSVCLINCIPSMSVTTRTQMPTVQRVQPCSTSAGSYGEGKTELRKVRDQLENRRTSTYYCESAATVFEEKGVPCIRKEARVKGSAFPGKGSKTFRELLAEQDSQEESDSGGPIVEKTLYVDTIQKVESPYLRPLSPNVQSMYDSKDTLSSREDGQEIMNERINQMPEIDFKKLDVIDGKKNSLQNVDESGDISTVCSSDESNNTCRMEMFAIGSCENQEDVNLDPAAPRKNIQWLEHKETKGLEKQLPVAAALKQPHQYYSQHEASPPLPKSPSDSWLSRSLPSKSAKKPTLRSYLSATTNSQNQGSCREQSSDTKWETLIKITQLQHPQLNHTEGLLTTIPETRDVGYLNQCDKSCT